MQNHLDDPNPDLLRTYHHFRQSWIGPVLVFLLVFGGAILAFVAMMNSAGAPDWADVFSGLAGG